MIRLAKKKPKKNKKKIKKVKHNIKEVIDSRDGGQMALIGYEYQVLYSCNLLLNFLIDSDRKILLEGIEDIDTFIASGTIKTEHIQLKFSKERQDASFLKSILKNFLEVYVFDKTNDNRYFVLIYDFDIADGNLKKLISGNMDLKSRNYWNKVVNEIRGENNAWDWLGFNFDHFLQRLKFTNIKKIELISEIEKTLIDKFQISVGNESLYVNGLFCLCFEKMRDRGYIGYPELISCVQLIKDNIDKGINNPAHKWIEKVDFCNLVGRHTSSDYYEGKKAEPVDIVNHLPIRRETLEDRIEKSIMKNTITIIKSSSGQGKTTLAWQVAYNLRNQYYVYKLNWCNKAKELDSIVEYFKSRIKIGERLLIVLDNLDVQLKEWNILSQYLSRKISINYKLLVTTREDDWYLFSGDPTNLKDMKIIDISLDGNQAENIYVKLKAADKIHSSIQNWQSSWEMVSEKGLLIEYIYLLTHGEMINDRISQQIKNLQLSKGASIKTEVLRQIALADVLGIKLPVRSLTEQFSCAIDEDIDLNELLKSIENEFYIRITDQKLYVEGLHAVRSEHIVKRLHEYISTSETILKMLKIVDEIYISKLYSNLPFHIFSDKDKFYKDLIEDTCDNSYTYFLNAVRGLFSGSVLEYYKKNKITFDDADEHGGLRLLLIEINPFNRFEEVDTEIKTLSEMHKIMPNDTNIKYLCDLAEKVNKFIIEDSDFYIYSYYLYHKLKVMPLNRNINDYARLASWLIKVDKIFDIVTKLSLDDIWAYRERWGVEGIVEVMYAWHRLDETKYLEFITSHKQEIFIFLKINTLSMKIYESKGQKEIHIEYLLLPYQLNKANEESVSRLTLACKILPIYELYCADAIKPSLDIINFLNAPNDAHKEMPKRNIVITFNVEFAKLWSDTIMSNYECASIYDWLLFWYELRSKIVKYFKYNVQVLEKILKRQRLSNELLTLVDNIRDDIIVSLKRERLYPHENRPFEKPLKVPEDLSKIKRFYFSSIRNYIKQMVAILKKEDNNTVRLAVINLRDAKAKLSEMQEFFTKTWNEANYHSEDFSKLNEEESLWIKRLIVLNDYYLQGKINKAFNRNMVTLWKKQKEKQLISGVTEKINQANEFDYKYVFPISIIEEGNFLKIPVIIKDFNPENEQDSNAVLMNLVPISELKVDYIYLLVSNEADIVMKTGLSISKLCLEKLKDYFETGDESSITDMIPPLPIEIQEDMLNCFPDKFYLEKEHDNSCLKNIDALYLKLWEYSQYAKYIECQDADEKKYLSNLQKNKKDEIGITFDEIKNSAPTYFVERINDLKAKVINENYYLGDEELNAFMNEIINFSRIKSE